MILILITNETPHGLYRDESFVSPNKGVRALEANICLDSHFSFLAPSGAQGVSLSVCLSGTSLSKALNLHLSLIGQSQVRLRSLLGLSELPTSVRRSLKYFVLFKDDFP